jgi:hypothetical protein
VPAPEPSILLAYGPAPGMELIPYFLSLLAWVGLACVAIFLRPIFALVRFFRKTPPPKLKHEPTTAPAPESPRDGSPDRA